MITLVMWYQPEIKIYKIKMMNQKYILKKILDSLSKLDFKETYAENLHRRLEAEKDQELQKLIKDRIYSLQITDEIKSVLVSEKVKEAAEKLGYRLIITRNKNSYLYNGVLWEPVDALELKHFLGKAFQRMGADKYTAKNVRIASKIYEQACYSLYDPAEHNDTEPR